MYYDSCVSVYIELVIFNNFCIDLLLIVGVQIIRRRKVYKVRAIVASIVGAIVATLYPISPEWAQIVIKTLLSPCLVAIFDKLDKGKSVIKQYFSALALFILLTYILGGLTYGISFAFDIDVNGYIQLGILALSIAILLLFARWIVSKRGDVCKKTCKVTINTRDRQIEVDALIDSGNLLTDDLTGLPVMILSKAVEDKLQNYDIQGFINVQTVGDSVDMPIVFFDDVKVGDNHFKAFGALSHKNFVDIDVILQNSMF